MSVQADLGSGEPDLLQNSRAACLLDADFGAKNAPQSSSFTAAWVGPSGLFTFDSGLDRAIVPSMFKNLASIAGVVSCVVGTLTLLNGQEQGRPSSTPLVLSHVAVIDIAAGVVKPEMTAIIAGDRIEAVGPSGRVPTPDNAMVVDAKGKFLIPGLWDAHYHLAHEYSADWAREVSLPLLVANGVTGVRDMGGDFELIKSLRKEIAS